MGFKPLSEVMEKTLRDLERKMSMNNAETETTGRRVLDLTGGGFLKKRGLKRDKANFVTLLVRTRADLAGLLKITNDIEVQEEIGTLMGFISETVELMYSMEEHQQRG